ncbi:MAG: DUF4177 domain-containing protein [Pyrinomonadaceae bacterium]|jgi:hypothetical protein|nr:DUF4177 domain-containing protein [Pyrinomonadaceae bacterium]
MKWEYKTVKLAVGNFLGTGFELSEVDNFINQFGQQGWELVSTQGIIVNSLVEQPFTKEVILIFKRPLA